MEPGGQLASNVGSRLSLSLMREGRLPAEASTATPIGNGRSAPTGMRLGTVATTVGSYVQKVRRENDF